MNFFVQVFKHLMMLSRTSEDKKSEPQRTHLKISYFGLRNFVGKTLRRRHGEAVLNRLKLLSAASSGNLRVVNFMLASGMNVDGRKSKVARFAGSLVRSQVKEPNYYCTPLHCATKGDHLEVVKLLISKGADVNVSDKNRFTPIHVAAQRGNEDVFKTLLDSGAYIHAISTKRFTPLHLAAKIGSFQIVDSLLSRGARVNVCCTHGNTPLHLATKGGHLLVVDLLLAKGAWINDANTDGVTPLHIATKYGHLKLVKFLILQQGAWINIDDKDGITPLHIAAAEGHLDLVKFLLSQGADFNWKTAQLYNSKGKRNAAETHYANSWTPLDFAIKRKHFDVVKELLKVVIANENDFIGPLVLAKGYLFRRVVKFVTTLDVDSETCILHKIFELAVKKRCWESVKVIVDKAIDINAEYDSTIQHSVAKFYTSKTMNGGRVPVLLQNKADPNWKDLTAAVRRKHPAYAVINLILEQGCCENTILECVSLMQGGAPFILFKPVQLIVRHYLAAQPDAEKPEYSCCAYDQVCHHWDNCVVELEKMKQKSFACGLSLYTIFAAKDINKTRLHAKSEEFLNYCRSKDCRRDYPVYADLILKKLRQGKKREELLNKLDKFKISAEVSEDITLNLDCQLNVASYLSNDALFNLIKAALPENEEAAIIL